MDVKTRMQSFLLKGVRERLDNDLDDMENIIHGNYSFTEANLIDWCDSMETLFAESLKEYFSTALFNYLEKCTYPSECHAFIMGSAFKKMSRAIATHDLDEELGKTFAVMKTVVDDIIDKEGESLRK